MFRLVHLHALMERFAHSGVCVDQVSDLALSATTAADGKTCQVEHYNLDMIISVGYRVSSKRGTQFRMWATQRLKEHDRWKSKRGTAQHGSYHWTGERILPRDVANAKNYLNEDELKQLNNIVQVTEKFANGAGIARSRASASRRSGHGSN